MKHKKGMNMSSAIIGLALMLILAIVLIVIYVNARDNGLSMGEQLVQYISFWEARQT